MRRRLPTCAAPIVSGAVAAVLLVGQARAWGASGHRIVGRLAMESLPADMPAFLRTTAAASAIGEMAREPDRWKGSGRVHDTDRDGGHFLDLGDDGRVLGGPALGALPPTREAYDTALRAVGADSWKAGWLPYSIVDAWQQLAKDFAYWRVDTAAARVVADAGHRAWFVADAAAREALILRDLGVLAHYVGDGSQPLHVTDHFNGWGDFPNPDGFTQSRVHAFIEGAFVRNYLTARSVNVAMRPYRSCACPIERRAAAYLAATNRQVRPFYVLYKAGGFQGGDARGRAFDAERLAAGASELRDEVVDAWKASAAEEVGRPAVKPAEVRAGRIDPYDSLFGAD
ncbi:MAG: S1/P1 Nuclease [Caulobacteraceae bacterium]